MRYENLMSPDDEGGSVAVAAPAGPTAAPAPGPVAAPTPAPATPPPGPTAAPAPNETAAEAAARVRDEKGRFAGDPDNKAGFWDPTWRERLAGGDEKMLKQLGRYASPEEVWKKTRELETRITSGALKPVLDKDADEKEIAQYRKDMGIPETADKYDLKDVKIDPSEKPFIDNLLKSAHATNQTPEMVAANVNAWHEIKEAVLEQQDQRDNKVAKESEDTLRGEWGTEYRRNINLIHGFLDGAGPQPLKEEVLAARLANGTPIGSSTAAMKMLLGIALKDNPAGVIVPAGQDPIKGVESRIAEIETMMKTKRDAYNKDEKVQAEYRTLLQARETMSKR